MNVSLTLQGIHFEWDSQKESANLRKHTVSFKSACEVFFDPFLLVADVVSQSGENREAGNWNYARWRLLHVIYVMREDVIRIVSARALTRAERKLYEDQ